MVKRENQLIEVIVTTKNRNKYLGITFEKILDTYNQRHRQDC